MLKTYKYRIYPTNDQRQRMDQWIGTCRFIYNVALETKIYAWQSARINLSAFDLNKQLKELKSYDWINDVNSQCLVAVMSNVETAFKGFFRGNGYPKFKKKTNNGSFRCQQYTQINFEKQLLSIIKIKNIPIKIDRKFEGKIKTVTISRTSTGKYFASILVDDGAELPKPKRIIPKETIGLDVGISNFVVTSEGEAFENIRSLKNNLQRLKVLQKRASRKKKGSNNRKKANLKVALFHEKITNKRNDYIHKVTSKLTNDSQVSTICIEDLNVKGMMKNHNLAQALNDVSIGEFNRQLGYKCSWQGINLIKIGRFEPSSKLCNVCRTKNENLILSDRTWTCSCGEIHDRDFNAALNIKEIGLRNSGMDCSGEPAESLTLVKIMKQENYISIKKGK